MGICMPGTACGWRDVCVVPGLIGMVIGFDLPPDFLALCGWVAVLCARPCVAAFADLMWVGFLSGALVDLAFARAGIFIPGMFIGMDWATTGPATVKKIAAR